MIRTGRDTLSAPDTSLHNYLMAVLLSILPDFMYHLRTHRTASSASGTIFFQKSKLCRLLLRLRIMTPQTVKRTAFQEYRCPYSRSVMQRKALQINPNARLLGYQHKDLCRLFSSDDGIIVQNEYDMGISAARQILNRIQEPESSRKEIIIYNEYTRPD